MTMNIRNPVCYRPTGEVADLIAEATGGTARSLLRFRDGSTVYCLPTHVGDVSEVGPAILERLERDGHLRLVPELDPEEGWTTFSSAFIDGHHVITQKRDGCTRTIVR